MLSEDSKILEFNQYRKADKASFIITRDITENENPNKVINIV